MDIKKALNISNVVKRLEGIREANTKIIAYKTENKLKGRELLSIEYTLAKQEKGACYPVFLKTFLPIEDLIESLSFLENKLLKEVEKL